MLQSSTETKVCVGVGVGGGGQRYPTRVLFFWGGFCSVFVGLLFDMVVAFYYINSFNICSWRERKA